MITGQFYSAGGAKKAEPRSFPARKDGAVFFRQGLKAGLNRGGSFPGVQGFQNRPGRDIFSLHETAPFIIV
jgi:hypothetical protein